MNKTMKSLYLLILIIIPISVSAEMCYQETSNVSTSCGGLNTGSYGVVYDSWSAYITMNYTKPSDSNSSSLWQVKHGANNPSPYNITLPSGCWNAYSDKLVLRMYSLSPNPSTSEAQCYNGSSWVNAGTTHSDFNSQLTSVGTVDLAYDGDWDTAASHYGDNTMWITGDNNENNIYEEAMWWDIQVPTGAPDSPFIINTCDDLQNINSYLDSYFELGNNIDCSNTSNWNYNGSQYLGFEPIGKNSTEYFSGYLDGNGKTISNLYINRPGQDYVGLFGYIYNPQYFNLTLTGVNITGYDYTGGLAGYLRVQNYYAKVTGNVVGHDYVGGITGRAYSSTSQGSGIGYMASDVDVNGNYNVGGVAGISGDHSLYGFPRNVYSVGSVNGSNCIGGLFGNLDVFTSGSYNSYYLYSSAFVSGTSNSGGLVGCLGREVAISYSYWDINATNQTTSAASSTGTEGKTTAEMKQYGTYYDNWDLNNIWVVNENINDGYPELRWINSTEQDYYLPNVIESYIEPEEPVSNDDLSGYCRGVDFDGDNLTYYYKWYLNGALYFEGHNTTVVNHDVLVVIDTLPSENISIFDNVTFSCAAHDGSNISTWKNSTEYFVKQGFSGEGSGTSAEDPFLITNCLQLQEIEINLGRYYKLMNDIDCSNTSNWNNNGSVNLGFDPIGKNSTEYFSGYLDGNGKIISNLYINRPYQNYVGLFGYTYTNQNFNITLNNVNITGYDFVGGLVGYANSDVSYGKVSGNINGHTYVGGVIGYTNVRFSYVASNSTVIGDSYVGGITGISSGSYTRGNSRDSYSNGYVIGTNYVGGIFGYSPSSSSNSHSYFYSTALITGDSNVGGLSGGRYIWDNIEYSYWDINATNQTTSVGSSTGTEGKTTTEMKQYGTYYDNWDLNNIWVVNENINDGYPELRWINSTEQDYYLPNVIESYIEPEEPISNDDLSGYCRGVDFDGDNLTYYYKWYLNGALYFEGHNTTVVNHDVLVVIDILQSENISNFDNVTFSCAAHDGSNISTWKNSTEYFVKQGFSGEGSGTSAEDPFLITNCLQLQEIEISLERYYKLMNDIDCSNTSNWNNNGSVNLGFDPIGDSSTSFIGGFDGNGKTISNLFINRSTEDYVALFARYSGIDLNINLSITNSTIIGKDWVGPFSGKTLSSAAYIETLNNDVFGSNYVGGFTGYVENGISVYYISSSGNVNGTSNVGGLAGRFRNGFSNSGYIGNSYSDSNVSGTSYVGGLVGYDAGYYGYGGGSKVVMNYCYSSSVLSGTSNVGGIFGGQALGDSSGIDLVYNTYWDINVSGTNESGAVNTDANTHGYTTEEMLNQSNYLNFNFDSIWFMHDLYNDGYPELRFLLGNIVPFWKQDIHDIEISNIYSNYTYISDLSEYGGIFEGDMSFIITYEDVSKVDCSISGYELNLSINDSYYGDTNCTVIIYDGESYSSNMTFVISINDRPRNNLLFPTYDIYRENITIYNLSSYVSDIEYDNLVYYIDSYNSSELTCEIQQSTGETTIGPTYHVYNGSGNLVGEEYIYNGEKESGNYIFFNGTGSLYQYFNVTNITIYSLINNFWIYVDAGCQEINISYWNYYTHSWDYELSDSSGPYAVQWLNTGLNSGLTSTNNKYWSGGQVISRIDIVSSPGINSSNMCAISSTAVTNNIYKLNIDPTFGYFGDAQCVLKVNDTYGTSEDILLNFNIINNVPEVNSASTYPAGIIKSTDNVLGYCNVTDLDSDQLNVSYVWYKDGAQNITGEVYDVNLNQNFNVDNLSSSYTSEGENWTIGCMAYDGYNSSVYSNSSDVQINYLSEVVSSRIYPESTSQFYLDLLGYCNATDDDLDNITYYYSWYLNGELNVSGVLSSQDQSIEIQLSNISSNTTSIGQNWTFGCVVYDGIENSTQVNSTTTYITQNSVPHWDFNISNFTVSQDFGTYLYLTNLSDYVSDYENDTFSIYVYSENSSKVDCEISGDNLTLISYSNFYGSAECIILANDSYGNSEYQGLDIYVNRAPYWDSTIPSLSIKENFNEYVYVPDLDIYSEDYESDGIIYSIEYEDTNQVNCTINSKSLTISPAVDYDGEAMCILGTQDIYNTGDNITVHFYLNDTPQIVSSYISNSYNVSSENLLGYCSSTDSDSNKIYYNYTWYKNNIIFYSGITGLVQSGVDINVNNISSVDTSGNDDWTLECVAYDSYSYSGYINSSVVHINSKPVMNSVIIESNDIASTSELLKMSCSASDLDNSQVKYNWSVYKNGVLNQSGQTLFVSDSQLYNVINISSLSTSENDDWNITCVAYDGNEYSGYLSNVTHINSIPESYSSISTDNRIVSGDEIEVYCNSSDLDFSNVVFYWSVYNDGVLNVSGISSSISVGYNFNVYNISGSNTQDGTNWTSSCIAYDGYDNSSISYSDYSYVNILPIISNVEIYPDPSRSDEIVYCNWTYSDSDNDPQNDTVVVWYVDDVLVQTDNYDGTFPSLSDSYYIKNQELKCSVLGNDGYQNSTLLVNDTLIISNAIPQFTALSFLPSNPKKSNTLTCSVQGRTDQDGDVMTNYYKFLDSDNVTILQDWSTVNTFNCNLDSDCLNGDNITCVGLVSDGTDNSTEKYVDLNILNTAPEAQSVFISPFTPATTENLSCNYTYYDIDGDAESTAYYMWFLNDTFSGNTSKFLNKDFLNPGDEWTCQVITNDGELNSSAVNSTSVVISSNNPSIILVSNTGEVNEGDNITFSWQWTDNLYPAGGPYIHYLCNSSNIDESGCLDTTLCEIEDNTSSSNCTISTSSSLPYQNYAYLMIKDGDNFTSVIEQDVWYMNHAPEYTSINLTVSGDASGGYNTYTCEVGNATDTDSDSTINYYQFYDFNGNILQSYSATNTFIVNSGEGTHGNYITCSGLVYDNELYSDPINTSDHYSLTDVSNSLDPVINQIMTISVTASLNTSGVNISLKNPFNTLFSDLEMSYNNNTNKWEYDFAPNAVGSWNIVSAYGLSEDAQSYYYLGSNNTFSVSSTSSDPEEPSGGGGGGGGVTKIKEITQLANLTGFCGDGVCQAGENPANCWEDCRVNYDTLITCVFDDEIDCNFNQTWFPAVLIVFLGVVGLGAVYYYDVGTGKRRRSR